MSFLYRTFFILCLIFVAAQTAEAGNTRSVNVGDTIPTISWNVGGTPNCFVSTTYPDTADGIYDFWIALPPPAGISSTNFGGRIVSAAANESGYTFTCSAPGPVSDTSRLVVCDNVTRESDGGSACVAKAPAVPTGLTATPQSCNSGQINLVWTAVPGATSYSVRDGATVIYSGADVDYEHTGLTAGSAHSYTVRAQNALNSAYSVAVNATAPAVCTYPDLVVTATNFPAGPLYNGTGVTVGGTIGNTGSAATPIAVYSNVSYQWGGTGGAWTQITEFSNGVLNAGQTAAANTVTFTPGSTGTVYLQYCVDSRNQITEGSAESPNCTVSPAISVLVPAPGAPTGLTLNTAPVPSCGGRITADWNDVSGATSYEVSVNGGAYLDIGGTSAYQFTGLISGDSYTIDVRARNGTGASAAASATANASAACSTLTVGNCTIADLARTCTTTVTWDLTGAAMPQIYNQTNGEIVPGTNMAAGTAPITLIRSNTISNDLTGDNIIKGLDNSTELQVRTATASCGATSFFHNSPAVDLCQPIPNILITPNPAWIRSGDQANLTFGILANYPGVECAFSGAMSTAAQITHTASASRTNYVRTTDILTAAQVVRSTCTAPGLTPNVTGEVRVNVLPDVQEI
jgi:CARDB